MTLNLAIRQQEDFRPNADKSLYEDRMRYLVRCAHFRDGKFVGTYWVQRDEAATDKATTLVDLASGRWDHPLQVIEFNSVEHICSDVSEDFAIEIARRAQHDGECTLGRAAYEFCECHGGVELVRGLRVV